MSARHAGTPVTRRAQVFGSSALPLAGAVGYDDTRRRPKDLDAIAALEAIAERRKR